MARRWTNPNRPSPKARAIRRAARRGLFVGWPWVAGQGWALATPARAL